MTNEQFRQEYHLLNRVGQGSVVTYHAQSATGAMVVMVHFLQGTAEENSQVLRDLAVLDANHRARVLKVAEVDGQTAIVTKFILDFTTFNEWLAGGASSAGAPVVTPREPKPEPAFERTQEIAQLASVEPPPPAAPAREPGEFTRVFHAPLVSAPVSAPAPDVVVPPHAPSRTPEPQPDAPGEFTRVFRGLDIKPADPVPSAPSESQHVTARSPSAQPALPASSVQPPPTVSPASGGLSPERVQMPAVSPAPRPSSDGSSFEWPGITSVPAPPIPPAQSTPAGEYTRLFGKPEAPPVAPSSDLGFRAEPASLDWSPSGPKSVSAGDDSYFDRLAGGPPANSYELPINNRPSLPPQSFGGRSEYTRVITASEAMQAFPPAGVRSAPSATPVAASAPQKGAGDRILLFSLIGVVILAIVFVAVFAFVT